MSEHTFQQKRDALGTRYQLRVHTLSPVHVGSGESDLRHNLDFVSHAGRLFVLDPDKLTRQLDATQLDRFLSGQDLNQIVRPDKLAQIAAYTLPAPSGQANRIRPHVKIPGTPPRPYLPGSSIKGALRTALAWAILVNEKLPARVNLKRDKSGKLKPEVADDLIDQLIFRPGQHDPKQAANYDILRALHVGDSEGTVLQNNLTLVEVATYTLKRQGTLGRKNFSWHLETIPHNTELLATARLDRYLLTSEEARELEFEHRSSYLLNIVSHVNAFASEIIKGESEFYRLYGPKTLAQAYESLRESLDIVKQTGHSCLIQIAWGTGWRSKTVGLGFDSSELGEIRQQFNLGKVTHNVCHRKVVLSRRGQGWYCRACNQGNLRLSDVTFHAKFPKTRRLVVSNQEPVAPLGWLLLTFEPISADITPPTVPAIVQASSSKDVAPTGRPAERRLADLRVGETLQGHVTNTRKFGAFVDIGVGRDGLIHISNLAEGFVNQVEEVVQPGDTVTVKIVELDLEREKPRIGLRLLEVH